MTSPQHRPLRRRWRAVRRRLNEYHWLVVVADAAAATTLGFQAFTKAFPTLPVVDRAFLTFKLFLFDPGMAPQSFTWKLRVALLLAPAVTAYASFRTLTNVLSEQSARLRIRLFFNDHAIVCGIGDAGSRLATSLAQAGMNVVCIERDATVRGLGACREEGCVALIGNVNDETTLRQAGVKKARYVLAVAGTDATNADVAALCSKLCDDPVTCVVRVASAELCALLRDATLRSTDPGNFRLEFLNELDAVGPALYAEYAEAGDRIAVVGLSELGSRLVVHAARCAVIESTRPHLTVVGTASALADLERRLPALVRTADIDVQPDEHGVASTDPDVVFVCIDGDAAALTSAVRLCDLLPANVPVVACTSGETGLAELTESSGATAYPNLKTVSILDRVFTADVVLNGTNETIARAIHEDYVRNQVRRSLTPEDNPSAAPWDELPQSLKESNRSQAAGIGARLDNAGYDILPWTDWDVGKLEFPPDDVERMARFEHERWRTERERAGWKLGEERDTSKKRSPFLVDFDVLNEDVKELDREAVRGLPMFLAKIGYRIVKRSSTASSPPQ